MLEIKNFAGYVILKGEFDSIKNLIAANAVANLKGANLYKANLRGANLREANLRGANLRGANLKGANLYKANLEEAYLREANLQGANLEEAYLEEADLRGANLQGANLEEANLEEANLQGAKGLIKIIGVEPGNFYWKRFEKGLINNNFQFFVGLNTLKDGEVFCSDERILCGYPAFHFASRSWCALNYYDRPLEAKIQIPLDAKINEPWATDGKASADKIIILQVFDTKTGEDVTEKYSKID